jgi:hypothetical protein
MNGTLNGYREKCLYKLDKMKKSSISYVPRGSECNSKHASTIGIRIRCKEGQI